MQFDFKKLFKNPRLLTAAAKTEPPAALVSCSYCGRRFAKTQSLGGHISKKHPGMSINYAAKQQKRDENENERECRS